MNIQKRTAIIIALCFFFFALLSVSVVQADDIIVSTTPYSTTDFLISASSKISLCACQTGFVSLEITNLNSYPAQYKIAVNSDFVEIQNPVIVVEGKSVETINAYIRVPCDILKNTDITYTVSSSDGIEKEITQSLDIYHCQTIKAGAYESKIDAKMCSPFTSMIQIENIAPFTEEYIVQAKSFNGYVTQSETEFTLSPGMKKDIMMYYNLPCDIYGTTDLEYEIYAKKSNRNAVVTQKVHIPAEFDFSISLPEDGFLMCVGDQNTVPLTIRNQNNFKDEFEIKTKQLPDFSSLALPVVDNEIHSVLVLNGLEFTEINLLQQPLRKKDVGTYVFQVEATSKLSGITKQIEKTLIVENCYDFSKFEKSVLSDVELCAQDSYQQDVEFTYQGTKPVDVSFVLIAPEWVSLEKNTLQFKPNETNHITIQYNSVPNVQEKTAIRLIAQTNGVELYNKTNSITINNLDSCYGAHIAKDVSLRYDESTIEMPVSLYGLRQSSYVVNSIDTTYVQTDTKYFALNKSNKKENMVVYVDVDAIAQSKNISKQELVGTGINVTFNFVELESNYMFDRTVQIQITDISLFSKGVQLFENAYIAISDIVWLFLITATVCELITAALLLVLLILVCIACSLIYSKKRKFVSANTIGITSILVALLLFVFILILFTMPSVNELTGKQELPEQEPLQKYMYQDESLLIDINELFFDPDDNIERFEIININESMLRYESSDSIFTLFSSDSTFGNTSIEFKVTDTYNQSAQSGPIYVQIYQIERPSLYELYSLLCVYVNYFLLLICMMLVYVIFSQKLKPKKEHKDSAIITNEKTEDGKKIIPSSIQKKSLKKKTPKKNEKTTPKNKSSSTVTKELKKTEQKNKLIQTNPAKPELQYPGLEDPNAKK